MAMSFRSLPLECAPLQGQCSVKTLLQMESISEDRFWQVDQLSSETSNDAVSLDLHFDHWEKHVPRMHPRASP